MSTLARAKRVARRPAYAWAVERCRARATVDWLAYDPAQKRDEQGRWTDGFMSESALEAVADLVSIVDDIERDPTVEPSRLHGGQSAETLLFTLPDGRKIVRKRAPEWGDSDAPKRAADAEQLGSLVANALDAPSARVLRTDEATTYIEFIPGDVLGGASDAWGGKVSDRVSAAVRQHGVQLGLVDVLIANQDRNLGNILQKDDGSFIGIDAANSWYAAELDDDSDDDDRNSFMDSGRLALIGRLDASYPASHFAREPRAGDPDFQYGDDLVKWIDNPLTPSDVDETRRRLEMLRSDFKRLGREDWLDYSLSVLDELAPHAKGTESIYG
jgi:hypothetical protein